MKKNRKVIMSFLILLLFVILMIILLVTQLSNPLNKPNEELRNDILQLTPLGTEMESVIAIIENNNKWEIRNISYEFGYRLPNVPTTHPRVGEKHINVYAGRYRSPRNFFINTYVNILWGFDKDGVLIDVYIWKTYDTI